MSNPYELVRYVGLPFDQTHPDRLATLATLFGMNPTSTRRARVLEIGCCDGGNLTPMAVALPESEFVGIDLTVSDIERANQAAYELGLTNLQFHVMDLTALPGPFEKFDYIIAHGIYSWIPPTVRERMLGAIKDSLAPNGVAFVSYNTLPGGHLRIMLREMMLYHVKYKGATEPSDVIARARELLEFVGHVGSRDVEYGAYIRKELEGMAARQPSGWYHDELSEFYQPVYFHEFVSHANRHGLQFLSESNYFEMRPETLVNTDTPVFKEVAGDTILREQYLDFARCRRFRQSLLCHRDIPLQRTVQPSSLEPLYFSTTAKQVPVAEGSPEGAEEFHGPHSSQVRTAHPVVLKVIHRMVDAAPSYVSYAELREGDIDPGLLFEILHALYGSGLVELRSYPIPVVAAAGERPSVSRLARWQAARGGPVTSLRHNSVRPEGPFECRIIELLDGTRTRAEVVAELVASPALLPDPGKSTEELLEDLEGTLATLARMAILTA